MYKSLSLPLFIPDTLFTPREWYVPAVRDRTMSFHVHSRVGPVLVGYHPEIFANRIMNIHDSGVRCRIHINQSIERSVGQVGPIIPTNGPINRPGRRNDRLTIRPTDGLVNNKQ